MRERCRFIALLSLVVALIPGCKQEHKHRVIIGRVENVMLEDMGIELKARIDTGAGVSSLDAQIVEVKPPETEGEPERIIFKIRTGKDKTSTIERDIVQWAEIKGKGTKKLSKRPVVVMDFCIGGKTIEARVNLADRRKFIYPLLIGRNVLRAGNFLIDPRKKFMKHPRCS